MVVPTTVSPPAVDELDIQALANVPMPVVQAAPPRLSPYSRTNLPEFMQQRVEVAPGLFGPQQGLLGAAPVGAPADYGALEQQFVESFAARPEYFGRSYTPGAMMPGGLEFAPISIDEPLSLEEGLKTAAMLRAAYEFRDPIMENIIDPLASGVDDVFFEPLKENVFEPIIQSEPVQALADAAIKPVEGIVDIVNAAIPEGTGTAIQEAKDKFFDAIDVRFNLGTGDTLDNLKKTFEGVSDAAGYIGDIQNLVTDPSLQTAEKAIDAANSLYAFFPDKSVGIDSGISIGGQELAGMEAQEGIITGELAESLKNVASAANIAQFAKDPTIEGAPVAYESAAKLAGEFDIELPGVESAYVQTPLAAVNVLNAAKALEGGIDSPVELANVMSGISSLPTLGLTPDFALTSVVGPAGPVQPTTLSSLGSTLGPIAAAYSITTAIPGLLEGGAAGEIPRSKYTLGFEDGRFGETSSRTYDKAQTPTETAKRDFGSTQSRNAIDFVNWLQNSMGYEVDQTALKKWEASDQDEIVDQYGYFEQRHKLEDPSVNAADFVTNMLQAGVLKPTAETPPINMQAALNVLTPDVTYYSDYRDIAVAGNVNVPYLLSQINPYPEGYDQTTGQLITPEMQEQRELATAYAQREPAPPQTIGEFIGSITPQQAMALPVGIDYSQPMPDFMPPISEIISLPGGYRPEVRRQGYVKPMNVIDLETLQRMLPV